MKKFKLEYIFEIIEIIILILQCIFINKNYITIIGVTFIILYFVMKLILRKPVNFIDNKIDVVVVLLTATTLIPLITNKYVSFSDTINRIVKYINVLGIYFFYKDSFREEKCREVFLKTIVIFSGIVVVLGIIQLCYNYNDLFSKLQFARNNGENRLMSLFGSPNNFSPFLASVFFINYILIYKEKNTLKKSFYQSLNFIFLSGILLTFSKATFVVFAVILLLFFIIYKNNRKEIIFNLIISGFMSILFDIIYEVSFNRSKYWIIFFTIILFFGIIYFISTVLEKYKINSRVKKVKNILLVIVILIVCSLSILEIFLYKEFVVFFPDTNSNYNSRIISHILPNSKYVFEFNIYADLENTYKISLIERDSKNKVIKNHEYEIDKGDFVERLEIETTFETNEIKIEFHSAGKGTLIVKELNINDKKIKLEYTFLPTKLVNKLKDININYKTLVERLEMIKNSFKLSLPNIFTGLGGQAWKYKQQEVINYEYNANNLHSYPFQLLLEFGIISFILYLIFIIFILYYYIKNKDKNIMIIGTMLSLLIIILHSSIDIELENLFIFNYFYILIAIYSSNIKGKENIKLKLYISNIILIIILFIIVILGIKQNSGSKIGKIFLQRSENDINSNEYKQLSTMLFDEAEKEIQYERYGYLDKYYKIINYVVYSDINNKKYIVDKYLNKISEYENKELYNEISIVEKIEISNYLIKLLEKQSEDYGIQINKLKEIITNSYPDTINKLENYYEKAYINNNGLKKRIDYIYEEEKIRNIVEVAQSQIGTLGGEKYYTWFGYEEEVYWCACFVSWCADQSGDIAKKSVPKFSVCDYGVSWFRRRNRWLEGGSIPEAGDIIFFDKKNDIQDGIADHVGIVEKYDSNTQTIYTIQGNTPNNSCEEKCYNINDIIILGYGIVD